jgi:hypothetical protein
MSGENGSPSPADQVRALFEETESRTASALEELVSKPSFGALMARSAENFAAVTRIGSDIADLVLRNLRLAGRADITRLARQLHRTEDKLERVLQEVEQLRDEVAREEVARDEVVRNEPARDKAAGNGPARNKPAGNAPARNKPAREHSQAQ